VEKWTITNSLEGSSIEWENRVFPEDEPDRRKITYDVKDPNFLLYSRIAVIIDSHRDLVRISDDATKKGRVIVLVDREHASIAREEKRQKYYEDIEKNDKKEIIFTEEDLIYLPLNSIVLIKRIKDRYNCSLKRAKEVVNAHPLFIPLDKLYIDLCPNCNVYNSIKYEGPKCNNCGKPLL